MRITILLLLVLFAGVAAHAQTASAEEKGPKMTNSPEAQFPSEGIAMGLGGVVWVYMDVAKTGKTTITKVTGPPAPCSILSEPRALALREAAVAAAKQVTFEAPKKDAKTTLQIRVPYPPLADSEKGKPRYISAGVLNGKATSLPAPRYPASAQSSHAGGIVTVMVTVDFDGKVIGAAGNYGDPLLLGAAMDAACHAKFPPILLSGNPVKVSGVITYNFVP